MLSWFLPFFAVLLAFSSAIADECARDEERRISSAPGQEPYAEGYFNYESSVECRDDEALPYRYIWCVENHRQHKIIDVEWGNETDPTKYFDAQVIPSHGRPRTRSSQFGLAVEMGRITYDSANEVKPDPETIYPSQNESSNQCGQDRPAVRTTTNKLLEDQDNLQSYLAEHGKISHTAYGIFDLPASREILSSLKDGSYSKYIEGDFITLAISFQSEAELNPESEVVIVSNDIYYEPKENTDRASEVLSEYKMFIVPGGNVFATAAWRLPENQDIGFPIEPGKGGRIKLSTDLTQTLVEREASLYIVDSDRHQLGRLVVNFLGPPERAS